MMSTDWLLIAAGALGVGGVWVVWRISRHTDHAAPDHSTPSGSDSMAANHIKVLPGKAVLDQLNLQALVDGCRDRMGFD
jgi:hypothetical protein